MACQWQAAAANRKDPGTHETSHSGVAVMTAVDRISKQITNSGDMSATGKIGAESGASIPEGASVRRRFTLQLFNLVLDCQLAPLEIHDFEVVDRRMVHRI